MTLYSPNQKVAEIIFHNPAAIPVLNRFGIRLGVGAETLAQCCCRLGLEENFVETILNISLNEDYFPEKVLKGFNIINVRNYLLETDRYYIQVQLPNIATHLDSLIQRSVDKGNLALLRNFFGDLSEELLLRASRELKENRCNTDDWQPVADCTSDLLSFFVIHLRGDYDENLCNAVVNAIFTLYHDLRQTVRIRQHVLIPLLNADE